MWNINRFAVLLSIITLFGFALRAFNLDWDNGYSLHPDERAIFMISAPLEFPNSISEFLSIESPLNPKFFAYGSFPLYLLKLISSFAGLFNPIYAQYDWYWMWGRLINVTVDSFTIILVALLAIRIFTKKTIGLFAAFLYAIAVLPIQTAHFYVVDLLLTFFMILVLHLLLKFIRKPSAKQSIFIGIIFGLALATKTSALPLMLPISVAALSIPFLTTHRTITPQFELKKLLKHLRKPIFFIILIVVTASITFVISEPYALIDHEKFIANQQEQARMTKDAFAFPYTFQYVTKTPYLYEISNMYWWGLGPSLTAAFLAGFVLICYHITQKKYTRFTIFSLTILISFGTVYFAIVGSFAVGWMRYMLPLYPILCVIAGVFYYHAYTVIRNGITDIFRNPMPKRVISIILASMGFGITVFWTASFMHIYTQTNTRISASAWMLENIPDGSKVLTEHWDDRLPLRNGDGFTYFDLPMYDPDTPEKWELINQQLHNADYLIISSNRLYTPLMKLTDCRNLPDGRCYPRTAQYYRDLFSGNHEYQLIQEFSSYPTVPFTNVIIDDQTADESFTVYDHPKVLIFRNMTK